MSENGKKKLSREEVAALEVGHTDVSPAVARFLIAVFLLVITGVPAFQLACELRNIFSARPGEAQPASATGGRKLPQCCDVLDILPSGEEVRSLDGFSAFVKLNTRMLRDINGFEDDLEGESVLQKALIPPTQSVLTGWLGAGNEKVYCGRDRWLFFRPGIDYLTGRGFLEPDVLEGRRRSGNEWTPPPQPDPVKAIVHFRRQLAARGIELVVVPTPVKPMVYPEKFSGRFAGAKNALQNPSFEEFKKRLANAGVKVFDPVLVLMDLKKKGKTPVYLETDTHWSPAGMELVAAKLAGYVRSSDIELRKQAPAEYGRKPRQVENLGDIAAMLKLPESQGFYRPEKVAVHQVMSLDGEPWSPDPKADVLLLGDSFSNIYSLEGMNWGAAAGFAEQLSFELRRTLDRIVVNDDGAHASRQILARELLKGGDRLAGKKLVVWQFAVRELAIGDWKLVKMKLGRRKKTPKPVQPSGGLVVEGKVLAAPRPPKPGAVPYKDAVIALHLGELKALGGKLDSESIVVYMWVMRDNRLTPAAGYKPGLRLRLRLRPWDEMGSKYGSYKRLEINDPEILMLDAYWGEPAR